ncbi:MAG: hypothetical protein Q9159_004260 [Coniocarpon cinnabarinum]
MVEDSALEMSDSAIESPTNREGSKKRKRNDEDSKTRRKKSKQAKRAAKAAEVGIVQHGDDIDETNQINRTVARMDGALFADYLARAVKRFEPKLSLVEVEDLRIPQSAFADGTNWTGLRTCENLPSFLESTTNRSKAELSKAPVEKGAPHTIVLCGAAIRAADVTRALRCYQSKEATVAKMFAKHIKLKDAIEFTKGARITVGVGTAQRIQDLINEGALSLSHLRHVIIDGSWSGPKKRTLFEQSDAAVPTVRLLARQELKSRLQKQKTSILVF